MHFEHMIYKSSLMKTAFLHNNLMKLVPKVNHIEPTIQYLFRTNEYLS